MSKGDSSMDDELQKKILGHYQRGEGSIQDIARVYRVTVQEVLEVIGEGSMGKITMGGDLIDASEAGPTAQMNYGQEIHVPFNVD